MTFNKKGNQLFYSTWSGIIEKYDFDRCTGILSNKVVISTEKPFNQPPGYVSACFSPNDSLLYILSDSIPGVIGGNNLYQINLATQPLTLDSIYHFSQPVTGGAMKLAADNKIYIAAPSLSPFYLFTDTDYTFYNTHLSVINQPNMFGLFCDLQPYSFYLGGYRTYWDLPNNANYNLGALVGSVCDTLTTALAPVNAQDAAGLSLTYINQWQKLYISATKLRGKKCTLKIYGINGTLIYQNTTITNPPFLTTEIDCNGFSSGMYLLNLTTEVETVSAKFVKQ